jgi:phosphate-selective porin OprO/OprP
MYDKLNVRQDKYLVAHRCIHLLLILTDRHISFVDEREWTGSWEAASDSTVVETMEAGGATVAEPKRKLIDWNDFEGPLLTIHWGLGFLVEGAAYAQDEQSRNQFDLSPAWKVRDFRFLLKGKIKTERPITWTSGIMYDGATESWLFRETGIMVAVPELWGHLFIGRTKEGISLNKVMSGYSGWTMERATITDATLPILADGIKWLGHVPELKLLWNIGYFNDVFSEGQSFSTYDWQIVTRIAWLPVLPERERPFLHLGVNGRYGDAYGGSLRIRSRPEASPAPYFVDTDKFPAHHSRQFGVEAYYRLRSWLFGMEYYAQSVSSPSYGNPLFHGGDIVATWNVTGETRPYNIKGGYFQSVSPAKTVFEGGPGAVELVLRLSYVDLNSGLLQGGTFWRLTPMANWHLSDNLRLEFVYGYGSLDRFGYMGNTSFFQFRIQTVL